MRKRITGDSKVDAMLAKGHANKLSGCGPLQTSRPVADLVFVHDGASSQVKVLSRTDFNAEGDCVLPHRPGSDGQAGCSTRLLVMSFAFVSFLSYTHSRLSLDLGAGVKRYLRMLCVIMVG